MISEKTLKALEYDKILAEVCAFAVLGCTKEQILSSKPLTSLVASELLLKKTEEAYKYLFTYSTGGIYFFDDITDELKRVDVGGVLNNVRFKIHRAGLEQLFVYPMGGYQMDFLGHAHAHNTWIDVADAAGIIPFFSFA